MLRVKRQTQVCRFSFPLFLPCSAF